MSPTNPCARIVRNWNYWMLALASVAFVNVAPVLADREPVSASLDGGTLWTCTSGSSTDCDSTNGGYVQVQPGQLISVSYTVSTDGSNTADDWFATGWSVVNGSSSGCDNFEPDHTGDGTYMHTWNITAPAADGVYDLDLHARINDGCSSGSCGCMTLKRAIIVKTIENPPQTEACGFDLVLVIDSSGSIDNTELAQMKSAFQSFVSAFLPATPTEIAIVEFDTSATVTQGFTSNVISLQSAINSATSGGYTNWDDALADARTLLPHRLNKPDLILFASDGNPNRRGGHTLLGHSGTVSDVSETNALAWAVAEANAAKSAGARIITLGIGTDLDAQSMVLISSPDSLITSNFADLANDLADLAIELCGGTVTVHKIIDQDGNLGTAGDQKAASGWSFQLNVDAPDSSNPGSGNTDVSGNINFDLNLGEDNQATVDVIETVQSGYSLVDAECTIDGNPIGTPGASSVDNVIVGPLDIVSCNFFNSPLVGACCNFLKGTCANGVTQSACDAVGDYYGGDGSNCESLNPPCDCSSGCQACMEKSGNGTREVQISLVSAVFNGTNTVFTYRVCQDPASNDLNHWVLGMSETCCNNLVSASGGSFAGSSCSKDPATQMFGLKFETNGGVSDCDGSSCSSGGALFTVTLAGNVETGCVKTANKTDGSGPDNYYGCVQGPSCPPCENDGDCDDGVACTNDTCNIVTGVCSNIANNAKCSDGVFCNGVEICNAQTGCYDGPDPCAPPLLCNEGIDACVSCLEDAHCNDGQFCNGTETCVNGVCQPGTNPCTPDNVDCTVDSCDETNNVCLHTPNNLECNDGNFCTDDVCDPILGCLSTNNNNLCDDGNECTQFDRCQAGTCAGDLRDCSFLNDQCNVGVCDLPSGLCVAQPTNEGGPCEDGLYCTVGKTCVAGMCSGALPRDCSDGIPCTIDACDEVNNICTHTADDSLCNNNLFCDGVETCDPDFGCLAGTPPCSDGIACTVDTCDEVLDLCVFTPDHASCQDGVFCNGAEVCDPEFGCQLGANPCPDDNVACTVDSCDEANDACVHQPNHAACDNSLYCDGDEICDPLFGCQDSADPCAIKCDEPGDRCVECLTDGQCDDGLFCNGAETCNTTTGLCQNGADPCPADSVACTVDSCDEANNVCLHVPNDAACQDGLFCNGAEVCHPTLGCQDSADPCPIKCDEPGDRCVECLTDGQCDDGLYCNGAETCNTVTGLCQSGSDPCPSDGVACTVDSCDETNNVCLHVPNDGACQNGLYCDGMEVCHPTLGCQDSADPCAIKCDEPGDRCVECLTDGQCDDGLYCNGAETCNTTTGLCQDGADPCPADSVACTVDSCDEANNVCLHVPDDAACQNGLFCDGMEVCHPTLGCQDSADPCPIKCDEPGDRCVECLTDGQCDDGLYCNGAETCNTTTGMCQSGADPCPADSVACTVDSCDEANNVCLHTPNDAACQNGLFCDGMEVCHPTLGCQDSADPCPIKCDEPGDRCVECLTDGQCDDGLYCNGAETCNTTTGFCQNGADPCPSDGVDCTVDTCDEDANACVHTPNDGFCQNGEFCDGVEVCDPVQGCLDGNDPCASPLKCDEPGDRCVACLTDGQCNDGLYCNGEETCNTVIGKCQPGVAPCPPDFVDCTVDICDEDANACLHVPDDSACQNGLFCDGNEVCDPVNGCQDAADPCPIKCDEPGDRCVQCLSDGQCDDGLFCNGAETCDTVAGVCQPGTNPCPADNVACTIDGCDETANQCLHVPDDSACQNGLYCDGNEVCDPVNGCQDGPDPCPVKCDEPGDRCVECLTDGQCDDGLFCNGAETCNTTTGMCQSGANPCPPDSVACTDDVCDEAGNQCLHLPNHGACQNGLFCDGMEICDPLQGCLDGPDACPVKCDEPGDRCVECLTDGQCDDGLYCNGAETCNTTTGLCQSGASPCPPDSVACTVDLCDESTDQCQHVPDHNACQNGLYCDGDEVCDPLQGCLDGPNPCPIKCDEPGDRCVECLTDGQCDDGLYCNGAETCDTVAGSCLPGNDPCPPDAHACTIDVCDEVGNQCMHVPDNSLCQNGLFCDGVEICDPAQGCVDAQDPCPIKCDEPGDRCVECLTDGQCDDGLFCNGMETCDVVAGVCRPGIDPCPPDGVACTLDGCDEDANVCTHQPDATSCNDNNDCTSDICDPVQGCQNPPHPAGTMCGTSAPAGPCDNPDLCDGAGACLPNLKPPATICRPSGGDCDLAEFCTGDSANCPPDGYQGPIVCRPSAGICDQPEVCPGNGPQCPTDSFLPPSTECRVSAGVCDLPEFCTGVGAACPGDTLQPQGTVCRTAAGDCDAVEACTGVSATCPPDGFSPPMLCRPAAGPCDQEELCTGSNPVCPPDGFSPNGIECRPAAGPCDVPEVCSGAGISCPIDGFVVNTVVCRGVNGVCDIEEKCTGTSAQCPADGFAGGSLLCRAADGVCDAAEFCSGSAAGCPTDGVKPSSVVCRVADHSCDAVERCTGSSKDCPADLPAEPGTPCTDDGDQCSVDVCDETAECIHLENDQCGACCLPAQACVDGVTPLNCINDHGVHLGPGSVCGGPIACPDFDIIPTVSTWGLIVLTLLFMTGAKVYFTRQQRAAMEN